MAQSDAGLFRQAVRGDQDAFWRLILPHRGLIYSVAYGLLKNHEQAEDRMQEVLMKASRSLPNLRDGSKLPSWLYTLTRNHVMDELRKEERLRRALHDPAAGPARIVPMVGVTDEKEEWISRMEEALEELPEPFRLILGMKYMNDYSCQEIAGILGISVPATKSRLFEARKLLRKRTEARTRHDGEQAHESGDTNHAM